MEGASAWKVSTYSQYQNAERHRNASMPQVCQFYNEFFKYGTMDSTQNNHILAPLP
jgi:hypothetical protein